MPGTLCGHSRAERDKFEMSDLSPNESVDAVSCLGRADHRHARLRAFVPVFRAAPSFFPAAAAGFLFFATIFFLALATLVWPSGDGIPQRISRETLYSRRFGEEGTRCPRFANTSAPQLRYSSLLGSGIFKSVRICQSTPARPVGATCKILAAGTAFVPSQSSYAMTRTASRAERLVGRATDGPALGDSFDSSR